MKTPFLFCAHCDEVRQESQTSVAIRLEIVPVKEADVEVEAHVRVCDVCHHDIFDESLDFATQDVAFKKYRAHHGLMGAEEILDLRKRYRLSQRDLAALIGVGAATIARYESGSIPEAAQSNLIALLDESSNVKKLLDRNRSRLSDKAVSRLEELLAQEEPRATLLHFPTQRVEAEDFPEAIRFGLSHAAATAQAGRRYFNGRNHDEVDWMPEPCKQAA